MDPSVSDPMLNATHPAAVADAGPADDPLEPCSVLQGFRVMPPYHTLPSASAPSVSLAMRIAPAAFEPLHDRGVLIDHLVLEAAGAPCRRVAFDGEQILGAPWETVQRSAVLASRDIAIGFRGLRTGAVCGERDHTVQPGVEPAEPGEIHVGQRGRRDLAAFHQCGQVPHRGIAEVFDVARDVARRDHAGCRHPHWRLCDGYLRGGRCRIEIESGRDRVRQVQVVDRVVAVHEVVEATEHGVPVFGRDRHVGNDRGLLDHVLRDGAGPVRERPECAGEQAGAQSHP